MKSKFNIWMHNISRCRGFAVIAKMTNMRGFLTDLVQIKCQGAKYLQKPNMNENPRIFCHHAQCKGSVPRKQTKEDPLDHESGSRWMKMNESG